MKNWIFLAILGLGGLVPAGTGYAQDSPNNETRATTGQLPQLLVTRQRSFKIPFEVQDVGDRAPEVQLYVSADQGRTWHFYARHIAPRGDFVFKSDRDGEYWFAQRTLQIPTQAAPLTKASLPPEIRVFIDTTAPKLNLTANFATGNVVKVRWEATDIALKTNSVKVHYQAATANSWQEISVDPKQQTFTLNSAAGQIAWTPNVAARAVNIRVEVADQAGNVGSSTQRVFIPKSAHSPPTDNLSTNRPVDPFNVASTNPAQPQAVPWSSDGVNGSPVASASNRPSNFPPGGHTPPFDPTAASRINAIAQKTTQIPLDQNLAADGGDTNPDSSGAGNQSSGTQPPVQPATSPIAPPVGEKVDNASPDSADATDNNDRNIGPANQVPPGQKARMTRANRFNLAYSANGVGPSGVARVELWSTQDGGRQWSKWGEDEDKTSPMLVEAERDGVYGFQIVIVNGDGFAGRAPRSGDLADVWVGVDSTAPKAELTSAIYGSGKKAGTLDIRWQASDDFFGELPIRLQFATSANGPWTHISASLPNTGQYSWRADARVPREIYLRIEVTDEAGNTTHHVLTQPISLEGLAPKAKIDGVAPIEEARRRAQERWNR